MLLFDQLPRLIALVAICAAAHVAPVRAQTSPEPAPAAQITAQPPLSGPVLLTISEIIDGQPQRTIQFDEAMLAALPQVTFTTTTIWTQGQQKFTGVPLAALLAATGMKGTTLVGMAANDYLIDIPVAELTDQAPIVAYMRNDKMMTTRDKGPLWVVYPYDAGPDYRTEVVYARSVWQLDRIEVQP